ncbi:MAG: DUF6512 family protein [Acutalibacteraceae bacterium]
MCKACRHCDGAFAYSNAVLYCYRSFRRVADWFKIVIFFLAAGTAYFSETRLLNGKNFFCKSPPVAFAVLCIIAAAFVFLTFAPPKIPLFRDPVTGSYGV